MEAVRSPSAANWAVVAGGEGGAPRCGVISRVVVHFRAPIGGAARHGGFSRVLVWRRATAVAPAFPRPPSPFSAFPSAEKQEEVKTEKDASPVEITPPVADAETEQSAEATEPPQEVTEPPEESKTPATYDPLKTQDADAPEADKDAPGETQVPSESPPETPEAETVKAVADAGYEPRTVRVRFVLQKPCRFGEQFLLVGDHHAVGSWNPDKAIPMEWSDGHVWAADDVELPVGEEIKYKFILRSLSGKIKWQPGADKVLQTYESADAIVVTGDWESAPDEKTEAEKEKAASDDSAAAGADGAGAAESKEAEVVADLNAAAEAGEEMRVVHEGDPVLIPGLASVAASEAEGKSSQASPVAAAEVAAA